LPYRLLQQEREPRFLSRAVLAGPLRRAFGTWTAPNAKCTPGIDVIELAPIEGTDIVRYDVGQTNSNVIGVPGRWPHADASATLALTTLTFHADSGEILDADMEINGSERAWSIGETPPSDGYDLLSALTHEAGHFLGLAHSPDTNATMFANYAPGSTQMRALHADDEEGVCWIYPNPNQRMAESGLTPSTACQLAPGNPSSPTCDPAITHGCAVKPGRGRPDALAAVLALVGLAFVRRRLRHSICKKKRLLQPRA
jgi:MYXO-CTERM domain-containing protein